MKKFVTLLLITLVSAIGMEINANTALATDTLVVKPVLMDSATNSEVDTLAMSVVAPELKWDVVGGKSVTVKPNSWVPWNPDSVVGESEGEEEGFG